MKPLKVKYITKGGEERVYCYDHKKYYKYNKVKQDKRKKPHSMYGINNMLKKLDNDELVIISLYLEEFIKQKDQKKNNVESDSNDCKN